LVRPEIGVQADPLAMRLALPLWISVADGGVDFAPQDPRSYQRLVQDLRLDTERFSLRLGTLRDEALGFGCMVDGLSNRTSVTEMDLGGRVDVRQGAIDVSVLTPAVLDVSRLSARAHYRLSRSIGIALEAMQGAGLGELSLALFDAQVARLESYVAVSHDDVATAHVGAALTFDHGQHAAMLRMEGFGGRDGRVGSRTRLRLRWGAFQVGAGLQHLPWRVDGQVRYHAGVVSVGILADSDLVSDHRASLEVARSLSGGLYTFLLAEKRTVGTNWLLGVGVGFN
jgi:hypothetical protein